MIATALALLLAAAPAPGARGVATARALIDDFQFPKALAVIGETLKEAGLDRSTLISLYELEGIALATSGAGPAARDSFARLLTLDPTHAMPVELPPKGRTLYFGARTIAAREALELTAVVPTRTAGFIESVAVTVKTSALLPVTGVRFTVSADDAAPVTTVVALDGARNPSVQVHGAHVKWSAALLGAHDAILRQVERDEVREEDVKVPGPIAVVAPPVAAAPSGLWVRPAGIAVGIGGVVAVGVGAVLGLQSTDARSKINNAQTDANGVVVGITQADAARLDATARSNALAANVLMIAGGAVAATGLFMFLLGPHDQPSTVSLTVGPAGVTGSGRF
jgi:hypothetical protein